MSFNAIFIYRKQIQKHKRISQDFKENKTMKIYFLAIGCKHHNSKL